MESGGLCQALSTDRSSEVFKREALESREKGSGEKRGKQKRRERGSKNRVLGDVKNKLPRVQGGVLSQIKAKENIVTSGKTSHRITIAATKENVAHLFTKKIGIYNKGKSSLLVSRRRPLHTVQYSRKSPPESEQDLKRVLGCDSHPRQTLKHNKEDDIVHNHGTNDDVRRNHGNADDDRRMSPADADKPTPLTDMVTNSSPVNQMEISPEKSATHTNSSAQILAIAKRISDGLHPRMVFPDSDYLAELKAELRKLMKQSTTRLQGQMSVGETIEILSLVKYEEPSNSSSSHPETEHPPPPHSQDPPTNSHPPPLPPTTSNEPFFLLPLFKTDEENSKTANDNVSTKNSSEFHLHFQPYVAEGGEPCNHQDLIDQFNLVEVELGTSSLHQACINPNTPSAVYLRTEGTTTVVQPSYTGDVILHQQQQQHCTQSNGDILDLLDNMHHQGIATSSLDETTNIFCPPENSKWLPTPERPPMFPQKLY